MLAFLWVSGQVGGAEEELATLRPTGSALEAEVATYAEVPEVLAAVDAAQANLVTAMTPEIRWSFYLNDMSLTIPRSTRLVSMTAVNDGAAAQLDRRRVGRVGARRDTARVADDRLGHLLRQVDGLRRRRRLAAVVGPPGGIPRALRAERRPRRRTENTRGTFFDVESSTQLSSEASSGRYLLIANGE